MSEPLELPFYSEPRGIFRVSASAGAGKTYRLALHFLRLLKTRGRPSEEKLGSIVALTFTNQAAAEMRDRIIQFLKHIALQTDFGRRLSLETNLAPAEAEAWLQTIFENYHAFQVRTIDSLIFTLIRGLAFELGLRPELSAEIREDVFLQRAFDRLLLRLREDPDLEEIFVEALHTFLEIEGRGGFNPEFHFRRRLRDIYKLYTQRVGTPGENAEEKLDSLQMLEETLREKGRDLCARVLSAGARFAYAGWENYLQDPVRYYWSKLFRKASFREAVSKEFRQVGEQLDSEFQELKALLEEYLTLKARAEVVPYERLFRELSQELVVLREEEGLLQAGSWTELLVKFLERRWIPFIYLKLGVRFQHFLIDEFQDTSRLQWEALRLLVEEVVAKGGSLLYVGDVKQAIYMWRGGDPELFFEIPRMIPGEAYAENLPFNFRSARQIVTFNNRLFSRLVRQAREVVGKFLYGKDVRKHPERCVVSEELARRIEETFSDLVQEPRKEAPEGKVEIVEVPSDEDREAFREEIFQQLESIMPELYERYVERGEEVAVLVRENREAEEIAAFLFGKGLPTVTDRALALESSPIIRGLLALLRYLDYPEDETALAGLLASPLFPSGESLLRAIPLKGRSWREYVFQEAPELRNILEDLSRELGRVSLYELVQIAVERFRLRERFPEEDLYLARFLSTILAYEEETLGLSDFLSRWEEEGLEEKVGLPRELRALRVFTIHAAKGLEFSAVVIPYLTWGSRGREELVVTERGLIRARADSSPEVSQARLREKAREVLESLNLLYVAFTRAKEELYVFLPEKTRQYHVGTLVKELLEG